MNERIYSIDDFIEFIDKGMNENGSIMECTQNRNKERIAAQDKWLIFASAKVAAVLFKIENKKAEVLK